MPRRRCSVHWQWQLTPDLLDEAKKRLTSSRIQYPALLSIASKCPSSKPIFSRAATAQSHASADALRVTCIRPIRIADGGRADFHSVEHGQSVHASIDG